MVPLRLATTWTTHVALERGVTVQQLIRDVQYGRARLALVQLNEDSGIRGYVLTGDRRFLGPYFKTGRSFGLVAPVVRAESQRLNLPTADLDAMQHDYVRWRAAVAEPLLADPHPSDERALLYRGEALENDFRRHEAALRVVTTAAAQRADDDLRESIERTQAIGSLANLVLLVLGVALVFNQVRSAQRLSSMNRLYENEKRIAESLQEAFLQRQLPALPGLALDATYVPATNRMRVGGDWFDAFELPDGRLLFSIGDVAGHGIEAAVVMNRARQAILAAALQESDPGVVLRRANATILLQEGVMVTTICGFIDPGNLEIVYSIAGHPPPLLVHAGAAQPLSQGGVPLGIFPESQYRTFVAHASEGDVLVLYTDGLIENERDVVGGEARLIAAAGALGDATNPARVLYDAVFGTSPPLDDVAILAVSFRAAVPPSPASSALESLAERPAGPGGLTG
jgi:serine phosphatase RsbU (regulator of sigma subunit)